LEKLETNSQKLHFRFFYFENTFWVITPRISFRPKCWKNFDKKSVILCKQKYFSNSIWKRSWSEHFLNFSALTFFAFLNDNLYLSLVKISKIRTKTVKIDYLIFQHSAEKIFEFFYLKLPPWKITKKIVFKCNFMILFHSFYIISRRWITKKLNIFNYII
jgi:hypothetical protein